MTFHCSGDFHKGATNVPADFFIRALTIRKWYKKNCIDHDAWSDPSFACCDAHLRPAMLALMEKKPGDEVVVVVRRVGRDG